MASFETEATRSGTAFPTHAPHFGVIFPPMVQRGDPLVPMSLTQRATPTFAHLSPPGGVAASGKKSVAEVVYNATPVASIQTTINELRQGTDHRPLIPVGLRQRAADALPPGIRQRAVAWSRAVARRTTRSSAAVPISRES